MNNLQQTFFKYITNPIAKTLDFLNLPKQIKLKKRREAIATKNRMDYIETTSRMLFETELQEMANQDMLPNPLLLPVIIARHVITAKEMFDEKKKNGYFDELNIMIK